MSKSGDEVTVINTLNKPFQFHDSDINLISADGVVFKIHKNKLQSSSSVFQVMFEAGKHDDNLELTDTTLESSNIVSLFLQMIYGHKSDPPIDWLQLKSGYKVLVEFIDKYDASAAREHLCTCLTLWAMTSKFSTDRYLLIGSR
ncbi:hypothetical protein I302_102795 [Kwoniella bestiolae CBS 10118]|uniref:BTB domain-containing protein n=1 Tax=Kwoniella bestiolae CBS 10118 TaxID=1296100 RepID=A0A1B9GFZ1_9TREE|nr:hypothetical protein I302_01490 [Kwoniella bestiolae CBS 10118]OCF29973.1 hypothetical protein I302_01490 [Kwoniella bestiolae CBS 10118]